MKMIGVAIPLARSIRCSSIPLVFGICFQTPLVMLFLERVGILQAEDFRKKRKFAILIMVVVAALAVGSLLVVHILFESVMQVGP